MNIVNALKAPTIHGVTTTIIGAAAIYSALGVLGVGIITPWPAKADVEALQTIIEHQQRQIEQAISASQTQSCTIYQILRDQYQKERDEAQVEVNKTNSPVAIRARDEAAQKVAAMNAKLAAQPCV